MNRCIAIEPKKIVDSTVSVIIAAYNAEPFLARSVRSALDQSLPPAEIIIVDDASIDGTIKVAEALQAENPCVRIVRLPENGGPSKARNAGLDHASGDWVAILDADDAFSPARLQHLIDFAVRTKADAVADNFYLYDAFDQSVSAPAFGILKPDEAVTAKRYLLNARPYLPTPDWGLLKPVFRRQFMYDHQLRYLDSSRHGEDFLLMLDLLLANGNFFISNQAGYLYTTRASGMSRTQLDYQTMIEHSAELLLNPVIKSDPALIEATKDRINSLRRLVAESMVQANLKSRKYGTLLWVLAKKPSIALIFLHLLQRKVRSRP